MTQNDLSDAAWRKSSTSVSGECVEVTFGAFLDDVRDGRFDL